MLEVTNTEYAGILNKMDTRLDKDSKEYKKLRHFVEICKTLAPQCKFKIDYFCRCFDLGLYTTSVVCLRPNGDSMQFLSPSEWAKVQLSETDEELIAIANNHFQGKFAFLYA